MIEANPINIAKIDHVVFRVRDMAVSTAFYTDVLGCKLERRILNGDLVQLRAGTAMIDLLASDQTPMRQPNVDHVCLQLTPWDEVSIRAHLSRFDIHPEATAQRYGALGNGPSLYISDPDGNVIELKGAV